MLAFRASSDCWGFAIIVNYIVLFIFYIRLYYCSAFTLQVKGFETTVVMWRYANPIELQYIGLNMLLACLYIVIYSVIIT